MELQITLPRSVCVDRALDELHSVENSRIRGMHLELTEREAIIVFKLNEFVDDSAILNHILSLFKERGCRAIPLRVQYTGVSCLAKVALTDQALKSMDIDLSDLAGVTISFVRFREQALDYLARTAGGVAIALGQPLENIARLHNSRLSVDSGDNTLLLKLFLENLAVNTRSGGALLPMQREALELARISEPNSVCKVAELLTSVGVLGLLGYAVLQLQKKEKEF